MDASVLEILEKRVSALELQVYDKHEELAKDQVISDLLYLTQTMISSALSCRENIVSLLEKMPLLNTYLDPTYMENQVELDVKRHYILELYPELKKTAVLLKTFQELKSFSDSQNIMQITNLSHKLNEVALTNLNTYNDGVAVTNEILQTLRKHAEIMMSIKLIFADLDKSVSQLEYTLNSKMKVEE